MKIFLVLLVVTTVLSTPAPAATAPDSITGKVYRESLAIASIRTSSQKTIIFRPDGRFIYLKTGGGGALILQAPYKIFLGAPHPDGTYTYQRTGDATATVTLHNDTPVPATLDNPDGLTETLSLTFNSPDGGGPGGSFSFTLSDLAALQIAPALNLSVRGRVEPGRPLIIGFVVPGELPSTGLSGLVPAPGFRQREVLIRVVGPSLSAFGIAGLWTDPDFQLFRGNAPYNAAEVHYADWSVSPYNTSSIGTSAAFRKIFDYVGAFPLQSDSKDAADVVRLDPGQYTVVCTAPSGDVGGEALVEVYFLP